MVSETPVTLEVVTETVKARVVPVTVKMSLVVVLSTQSMIGGTEETSVCKIKVTVGDREVDKDSRDGTEFSSDM